MANAARELVVRTSHPGPEHWKTLGRLIGDIKVKDTKFVFIRKSKVLKAVIFCESNYATDKETRNSFRSLFTTIVGTLLTFLSKTQRAVTLNSTEAEYVALSACTQQVKLVGMFL